MKNVVKISHISVKDYILDKSNEDTLQNFENLRQEESTIKTLFDIIDNLKRIAKPNEATPSADIPASFDEVEEIILNFQAGVVDLSNAQKMLSWLVQSPLFFERFYIKLNQVTSIIDHSEAVPELQTVEMKTDEVILEKMGVLNKAKPKPKTLPGAIYLLLFKPFWEKIKEIFKIPKIWVPRFAYSALALLLITIGTRFGVHYYNTSYQLIQAETLLKENHRIYMANTPRLSGGYASTGISMLMAEEDDKDSYLAEAFTKTKIAVDYDSELPKAKQLQAQIFIIRKQYSKADSVLIQLDEKSRNTANILNDLGVLKYSGEKWVDAANYFEAAIKADDQFNEALYNLVLTKVKLNEIDSAITVLNEYLKLKNDEGWKNAARNLLDELQQ